MSTLTDFLTGIANAIRAKKGTSAAIPAQNFADEITGLNVSVSVQLILKNNTNSTISLAFKSDATPGSTNDISVGPNSTVTKTGFAVGDWLLLVNGSLLNTGSSSGIATGGTFIPSYDVNPQVSTFIYLAQPLCTIVFG